MESTIIDLGPIITILIQALAGGLLGVGIWAVKKLADKFNLDADDKVREYMLKAVENGAEFAKKKVMDEVEDADWSKVEIKNVLVGTAAGYVMSKVPDAVKRFKLSEEDVKDLVLAKLNK